MSPSLEMANGLKGVVKGLEELRKTSKLQCFANTLGN
jgi:hypothetical protein